MISGSERQRIGEAFVRLGALSPASLESALARQATLGPNRPRLGAILVEMGLVTEAQVVTALARQLVVTEVSLRLIPPPGPLLAMIPRGLAELLCVMPVYLRRDHRRGPALFVAMADPVDEAALRKLAGVCKMPVRPMVTTASQIRGAISEHYNQEDTPIAFVPPPRTRRTHDDKVPTIELDAVAMEEIEEETPLLPLAPREEPTPKVREALLVAPIPSIVEPVSDVPVVAPPVDAVMQPARASARVLRPSARAFQAVSTKKLDPESNS